MVEVSTESLAGVAASSSVVHPSGCPAPRGVNPEGGYHRGGKRANAKSVIAAAMNYAANQQEPAKGAGGMVLQRQQMPQRPASADRPPRGAPPGYGGGNSRANIISAFGQGDSVSWTGVSAAELAAGFETSGAGGGVQISVPLDLSTQSSMVHRMMDREKNDVDPRDVHKLLPETMMASDSLDLHSELIHGKINQVIHDIMDAQVVQDIDVPGGNRGRRIPVVEEDAHHYADAQVSQLTRLMPSVELGSMDLGLRHRGVTSPECLSPVQATPSSRPSMRLSPTPPHLPPRPRSVQGLRTTYSAPSPVPGNPTQGTPVTGYPAAPALGLVHPLNQGRMSPIAPNRAQSPVMVRRSGIPTVSAQMGEAAVQLSGGRYTVVNPNAPVLTVGTIPVQYMQYSQNPSALGKYGNPDGRSSSRLSCSSQLSEPILGSPNEDELSSALFAANPDSRNAMTPVPGQGLAGPGVADLLNPDLDPNLTEDAKGKAARKFRSLEAALAWCHVQHSQKHVPVVPKDDVKKLVEFQLKNGKPIRAPWYRPTRSESDEEEAAEDQERSEPEGSDAASVNSNDQRIHHALQYSQHHTIPETEVYVGSENNQAPPAEYIAQRSTILEERPQPARPERPRCESAPLVRSWKQPPRHSNPNRRSASQSGNVKPLGTGFFCPPGFEFPAASPTAH